MRYHLNRRRKSVVFTQNENIVEVPFDYFYEIIRKISKSHRG